MQGIDREKGGGEYQWYRFGVYTNTLEGWNNKTCWVFIILQ